MYDEARKARMKDLMSQKEYHEQQIEIINQEISDLECDLYGDDDADLSTIS